MSALQYVEEKKIPEGYDKLDYNAPIIRRTLADHDMPNVIIYRAKQWFYHWKIKNCYIGTNKRKNLNLTVVQP